MIRKIFFIFPLMLLLSGCVTKPEITPQNNIAGTEWSIADGMEALTGNDPIEPFNRCMYAVTDFGMYWVVRPVGWIYGSILPRQVIQRIDYASDNLAFPGRMVSCFLQAKWKGGCTELGRFLVNSTVGIAGLFDPAEYYLGWYRRPENMGHAFATWGIGPGCLVFLPFSSATNPRDHIGNLFDSALDIKIIIPYANTIAGVNRAINSFEEFESSTEAAQDGYDFTKMGLSAARYATVNDLRYKLKYIQPVTRKPPVFNAKAPLVSIERQYKPQGAAIDTLRAAFFSMQHDRDSWWIKTSIWNTDFTSYGKIRSVRETPDSPKRYFQFWKHKKQKKAKNSLVLILPGIGTSYTGRMPRALAELLYYAGYDVVVTSNTMSWMFAVTKGSAFPGHLPTDTENVRKHLHQILDYLKKEHDMNPKEISVAGISLGAMQAIHLAKMESEKDTLGVTRFIAINPPVDILHALRRFDRYAAVTQKWTRKDFFEKAGDALAKYLPMMQRSHPYQPEEIGRDVGFEGEKEHFTVPERLYQIFLTEEQASALLGLNLRFTLRELVAAAYRNGFVKDRKLAWSRRFDFYRDADKLSAMDYVSNYVQPLHPEKSLKELNDACSLRSLEDFLKSSDRVRVLHNTDDPLLSEADRDFLDRTFGPKMTWFDAGGHLGNLYLARWQKEFFKMLRR